MCDSREINHHAMLVNRMAETLGLDLTRALDEGRLSSETWRDAVIACTGCEKPCDCLSWLNRAAAEPVAHAPDYCRNDALFTELAATEPPRLAAE